MEKDLFERALHIESPWFIKNIRFSEIERQLIIFIDFKKGSKFYYEDLDDGIKGTFPAYDTVQKTWQHLNFFEHECHISARVPRVKTDDNKVRLIKTPWEGLNSGFTLLFEALLLQLSSNMPVNKVSKLTGISNYRIWELLKKYVNDTLTKSDYASLEIVGIDETSSRKRHNYITLFVDLKEKKVIFITEGKSNKTIINFVKDIEKHNGKAEQIKHVSCDMSPAFIKGVRENLKSAKITFDKFHIIKLINEAVDKVRREEVMNESSLKKSRYIFLKNRKNHTKKEKEKFENLSLSKTNLKTMRAFLIRESFQSIYSSENLEDFTYLLNKWYYWATHSRLKPIIDVAKTIKAHWNGVINWMESKINNGILEGFNSIVQASKAKARGFKTFECSKTIIFLQLGKLDFTKLNNWYLPI
jgi:transposase